MSIRTIASVALTALVPAFVAASTERNASAADKTSAAEKAACLDASEQGQSLRKAGKLMDARDQLTACADEHCPALVRGDCTQWSTEVANAIPSLVFVARDSAGQALHDVTVTLDGKPLPATAVGADATPTSVDPGQHVVRFTRDGAPPNETTVTLAAGDKKHPIDATFAAAAAPVAAVPAATHGHRGSMAGPIIFGAAGVVGLGAGAVLVLSASSKVSSLRSTCAPNCATGDVDSARNRAFLGDALLGVGGASIVAAAYMFFTRDSGSETRQGASASTSVDPGSPSRTRAPRFDLVPSTSGARAVVQGEF